MRALSSIITTIFLIAFHLQTFAQKHTAIENSLLIPEKVLKELDKKGRLLEKNLERKTEKYLLRLQRHEKRLRHHLSKKDSALANALFEEQNAINGAGVLNHVNGYKTVYLGKLDSLNTAIDFLNLNKITGVKSNQLLSVKTELNALQTKLNASEQLKKYLKEREALLKSVFEKVGMIKKMKPFQKQVFYYQAQLNAFKNWIDDPRQFQRKLLQIVLKHPSFTKFFDNNSQLASLFRLPGSTMNPGLSNLQSLQTRNVFNQVISERLGSGQDVSQALRSNIESAQSQLNQLKEKLESYSGDDSNTDIIPGFTPNLQKLKTFFQRIVYGANVQSQKARNHFPVTSDIGLSIGYKLNDRSVIGVGASYKIGWGRGWNQIAITHQGLGIRTYIDWKIKSSFFISGGYEQNYRSPINSIAQLKNYQSWQSSGLIGLSKKYQVSRKLKGDIKLLWDFLSYQQLPGSQPFVFRIGYSLK